MSKEVEIAFMIIMGFNVIGILLLAIIFYRTNKVLKFVEKVTILVSDYQQKHFVEIYYYKTKPNLVIEVINALPSNDYLIYNFNRKPLLMKNYIKQHYLEMMLE